MRFARNAFAATAIAACTLLGAAPGRAMDLTGWTATGTVNVFTDALYNLLAGGSGSSPSGEFVAFGAYNIKDNNSIYQNISTVVGQLYKVTFSYAGFGAPSTQDLSVTSAGAPSFFDVSSWGTNLSSIFQAGTVYFTASSALTQLTFASRSGAGDNADILLTNVVITAVPGPVVAAGLPGVLALMGYGLYRRNRRSGPSAA